jgi:hypothetical protein
MDFTENYNSHVDSIEIHHGLAIVGQKPTALEDHAMTQDKHTDETPPK